MVGFLYCKEFEKMNGNIARGEVDEEEAVKEATKHQHLLPTTTTSKSRLMEDYSLGEEFAEVRSRLLVVLSFLKQLFFRLGDCGLG